jgi:Tol biopolymer transport system component
VAPPVEEVTARSGPLPQLPVRSKPPTSLPVQTPVTPPPDLPWSVPPEPRPRRRKPTVLIAVLTAVAVGAGATAWLLIDRDGDEGGGGAGDDPAATQTSEPTPPTDAATAAWLALPRTAAALGEQTLVAPREVEGNVDLYVIESDGTIGARLTTAEEEDVAPGISRDRRNIIYLRELPTGNELRTVSVDGQGDRPLFAAPLTGCTSPSRPAWNPEDPTQVAVACYGGLAATLRVVSLDGVTLHELDPASPHIGDLAFSPDGRQLAYWGDHDRDGRAGHLFIQANAEGGEAEQVTSAGTDNGPAWSPDGSTLAFSRGVGDGAREIYILDLEDPDAEPESLLAAVEGSADTAPAWSTDGRSIAFRSHRSAADQVWIVDAEGGEPRQLTTEGRAIGSPAWGYR